MGTASLDMLDSGLLGLAGAVLGFLIGTIVTFHHGIVTGVAGGLSPTLVALALGAGTGAGVLGGAWLAIRASRVDPATALTSA